MDTAAAGRVTFTKVRCRMTAGGFKIVRITDKNTQEAP